MKNTIKIFAVLALLVGFTSCNKFLEFEPEGVTLTEDALKTPDDLRKTINSSYDVLRSGDFMGGQAWLLSELLADNIDGTQFSGDWLSYYNRSTGIFITATRNLWKEPYIMIYRANLVMESFDLIEGLSDAERDQLRGEALFLRAVGHFELVRFFGQPYGYTPDNSHLGIPLRLASSSDALNRSTVGEVYAQVIADLTEAAALLPASNNGYATSWAAKGYLAKVYFQMNDFTNAFDQADDVVTNGGFTLDSLSGRFVPGGSTEGVFELISTGTANHSGGRLQDYFRSDFNRPQITLSQVAYVAGTQDTADGRAAWYTIANEGADNEEYYSTKFNGANFFNVPIVHLTELKLIRAEAAAENGNTATAITDLNDIRGRAGVAPVAGNTPASDLILISRIERRLEMVCEGNRLHELKRQAVYDSPNLTIRGAAWDCAGLVVQFPDTEVSANPDFTMNPEGGCN